MFNIITFSFQSQVIRTFVDEKNNLWFCGRDICDQLEYKDSVNALKQYCRWIAKCCTIVANIGWTQDAVFVSEQDVWWLIFFTISIFEVILPIITQHRIYAMLAKFEKLLNGQEVCIQTLQTSQILEVLRMLKQEWARRMEVEKQLEADSGKILFADSVSAAETSILVGDLAKILQQNGIDIGRNRLFAWLRENGWLIKQRGDCYNMPTQKAMEKKLFVVKKTAITHSDGRITISRTTKVTGKGQVYFVGKFLKTTPLVKVQIKVSQNEKI